MTTKPASEIKPGDLIVLRDGESLAVVKMIEPTPVPQEGFLEISWEHNGRIRFSWYMPNEQITMGDVS